MNDQLTGELGYVFLVSILDAALLSWLAVSWYRRAVFRLMRERTRDPPGSVTASSTARTGSELPHAESSTTLRLAFLHEDAAIAVPAPPVSLTRLASAYCAGAALYAAVIATLLLWREEVNAPVVAWLSQWWIHAWALVPTLVVILVLDRPARVRVVAWYLGSGLAVIALLTTALRIAHGRLDTAPLTNVFWSVLGLLWTAMVPLVLLLLMGWRRIRAVAPVALAVTLLFALGLVGFHHALVSGFNVPALRAAILESAALTSPTIAQYGLFLLASLPVGWIAWQLLRAIAAGFERKWFSDVQLIIDCWWIVVTADVIATSLSIEYGLAGVAGGLAAFGAYRGAVGWVLRSRRPKDAESPGRRLLLLRVFGYDARTESLFDRIAQRWRFHGPVQLIAGTDLATRTADPGDMLTFVNGHLAARYVSTIDEVSDRVRRLDFAPDPDGRHRVNEMYCRDHTWRPALDALLGVTDAVLMDLRSFSAQNSGCVFELQRLVRRLSSDSIVLACDETTDLPLLSKVLTDAWKSARAEGCTRGSGEIAVVKMNGKGRPHVGVLMQRLLGARQHSGKDGDVQEHRALL